MGPALNPGAGLADQAPPYRTVVFDCDSTLSSIEGIDELAGSQRAAIAELTQRAMAGEWPLEAVYRLRLERIRPSRAAVMALGAAYVRHLVPGARELIAALLFLGKDVRVLSGGLAPAVQHLAQHLGLAASAVHAVDMRWDAQGNYQGFDEHSPLSRSGGKVELVRAWLQQGAQPLVLIGDGSTDLEVAQALPIARFVGFGAVVARPQVLAQCTVAQNSGDYHDLAPWLLSARERRILSRAHEHRDWVASLPTAPST
jgi:phosphoserine phosphatase